MRLLPLLSILLTAAVALAGCASSSAQGDTSTASKAQDSKAGKPDGTPGAEAPPTSPAPVGTSAPVGRLLTCTVEDGKLTDCGDAYGGGAVVDHGGVYVHCDFIAGTVNHCDGPYDGQAPIQQGATWHDCDLAAGKIAACSELGYDGNVAAIK